MTLIVFIMRILTLLLALVVTLSLRAQEAREDICTHLQESGRVEIIQDQRLVELVGTTPKTYYANGTSSANNQQSNAVMGFRIRIFSGNQQTTSKNRCYSIQNHINTEMPDLPTYVTFKTPNWRISVGDFRTNEEASAMLQQLRKAFPAYAKEMFIVKDKINL